MPNIATSPGVVDWEGSHPLALSSLSLRWEKKANAEAGSEERDRDLGLNDAGEPAGASWAARRERWSSEGGRDIEQWAKVSSWLLANASRERAKSWAGEDRKATESERKTKGKNELTFFDLSTGRYRSASSRDVKDSG
jgi:hypothetical protein